MRYLLASAVVISACSNPVAAPNCAAEKRAVYAETFGGDPSASWMASDVWRLDPVHTVYFAASSNGCVVTRQEP